MCLEADGAEPRVVSRKAPKIQTFLLQHLPQITLEGRRTEHSIYSAGAGVNIPSNTLSRHFAVSTKTSICNNKRLEIELK